MKCQKNQRWNYHTKERAHEAINWNVLPTHKHQQEDREVNFIISYENWTVHTPELKQYTREDEYTKVKWKSEHNFFFKKKLFIHFQMSQNGAFGKLQMSQSRRLSEKNTQEETKRNFSQHGCCCYGGKSHKTKWYGKTTLSCVTDDFTDENSLRTSSCIRFAFWLISILKLTSYDALVGIVRVIKKQNFMSSLKPQANIVCSGFNHYEITIGADYDLIRSAVN